MSFEKEVLIKIVKRFIEIKLELWEKGNQEKPYSPYYYRLHGESDGIERALTVIDGYLNYEPEIHELIDNSRK